jgi:glucose/arabinose dehydrogenase
MIFGSLVASSSSTSGKIPQIVEKYNGLIIQKIADGLDKPSGFEFLGNNKDILITQVDGQVKLIRNYALKKFPVLDVNVSNNGQNSGLAGISSTRIINATYIFLSYVESSSGKSRCIDGEAAPYSPIRNRIYRYTWNASGLELENRTLILDLPPVHNGGKLIIGPDGQLFSVTGDLNREGREQNMADKINSSSISSASCKREYDNKSESSAILRTTLDGLPSKNNPFSEKGFERYYAYGIRNSLGLAFDPVTKQLWDTENAPGIMGEINFVKPGFNSSWKQIQGNSSDICCPRAGLSLPQNSDNLSTAAGSHYSEPKFLWRNASITALVFMNSSKLGTEYHNDLFVGDRQGNIYHFDLDENRENIVSKDSLPSDHLFASGFGPTSDMKIGPDGALYILSFGNTTSVPNLNKSGSLHRVATYTIDLPFIESQAISADHWGLVGTLAAIIAIIVLVKYHTIFLSYWRKIRKRLAPRLG